MIRKDPTSSASPPGANVRIDEHLVLDVFGAVSSESENCRKIAAESDILFLSVTTAPSALWGCLWDFIDSCRPLPRGCCESLEYANKCAPGWNDNDCAQIE